MRGRWLWTILGAFALLVPFVPSGITAESDTGHKGHMEGAAPAPQKSIRTTMKELHMSPGGVPKGWKFTLPPGDFKAGRAAYVKFECFKCHAVKGEEFPGVAKTATDVGPDLTGMGSHHLAEYFAESIISPNAVILTEKGYTGPDGKSIMPDYSQSMTVRELIDLVAYLKSLKSGEMHMGMPAKGQGAAPSKSMGGMPGMNMPASKGH